ncbi:DUF3466 family protein [Vibrio bathopelagicus]
MTCTKFKLTTVAALVFAATNANAELYDIVEVSPSGAHGSENYGVAVKSEDIDRSIASADQLLGCFDSTALRSCAPEDYPIAVESYKAPAGLSYREEVPFAMDNRFIYIHDDFDQYESYCDEFLQYSTCESWSLDRWYTLQSERNLSYVNVESYIEQAKVGTTNTVVNSLDEASEPIGVKSDGSSIRHNVLSPVLPVTNNSESRAWDSLTIPSLSATYYAGSISSDITNDYGNYFSSKGAIWSSTQTTPVLSPWGASVNDKRDDYIAQGSMRALAYDGTDIYAAGYNSNYDSTDLQDMNATIFKIGSPTLSDTVVPITVSGTEVDSNDDYKYTNSVATDINDNLVAIGNAKRRIIEGGTLSTKMFVVDNAASPTANFLTSGIFFSDAGGEAKSINNFNEIVGQVDSESIREIDGRERRHRGFIYPYKAKANPTSSIDERRVDIFKGQAWWLDDLTNDGNASGNNNKYRIIDASDINDAGVISATAIRCTVNGSPKPYDTTAHNSYCNNAESSGTAEEIVAVKLIPVQGHNAGDIQTRGTDDHKVDRQGGSLGWLGLTVLGLLGFRRKFK